MLAEHKKNSNPRRSEFSDTLMRTMRVAPSFLILALVGVAGAYFLGVPKSELAIAAAVPMGLLFLISRLMILLTPAPPKPSLSAPLSFKILATIMFAAAFACLDLFLSAAIFALLGLPDLWSMAVSLALKSGACSALSLLFTVVYVLQSIGVDFTDLVVMGLWKAFLCPTVFADRLFWSPHKTAY